MFIGKWPFLKEKGVLLIRKGVLMLVIEPCFLDRGPIGAGKGTLLVGLGALLQRWKWVVGQVGQENGWVSVGQFSAKSCGSRWVVGHSSQRRNFILFFKNSEKLKKIIR